MLGGSLPPQSIADLKALAEIVSFLSDKKNHAVLDKASEREVKIKERLAEIADREAYIASKEIEVSKIHATNEAKFAEIVKREEALAVKEAKYNEANSKFLAEKRNFTGEVKVVAEQQSIKTDELLKLEGSLAAAKVKLKADQAIADGLIKDYSDKLKALQALVK